MYDTIDPMGSAPMCEPFERTFTKDESIAVGFHAALESPRSFASPAIGQKVTFAGWCFDKEGKAPSEMWAEVGETRTPVATGWVWREDIVASFDGTLAVAGTVWFCCRSLYRTWGKLHRNS